MSIVVYQGIPLCVNFKMTIHISSFDVNNELPWGSNDLQKVSLWIQQAFVGFLRVVMVFCSMLKQLNAKDGAGLSHKVMKSQFFVLESKKFLLHYTHKC